MRVMFWSCAAALVYIYLGYPLLLWLVRWVRGARPVEKKPIAPPLSLIISAYNEAEVMREKLDNSLALNYPPERLDILVVSDASTDGTDEIVQGYADRGVRLLRLPERQGKSLGLNRAVPEARGEILVFSDANALYEAEALRHLSANFADPAVGYATGASQYQADGVSSAGWCETWYWTYDLSLKVMESDITSMVGADGAIYAIRKPLYQPLHRQDISDFVNPLQIIAQGYRGVFEPQAICYEATVERFDEEFRRKVRIAARSLRGLMQESGLLNPWRHGWYAVQLLSHKLLRWLTPVFAAGMALAALGLWPVGGLYAWTAALVAGFGLLVGLGFVGSRWQVPLRVAYLPYYFCLMNIASVCGMWKALRGQAPSTWEPER